MSDDYRGPYTPPTESPLTFDARRPERGGGGPAPVTLIVSVLVLIAIGGGAFYFYRNGVRGPGQAPQPVGAPVTDVKSPAPPQTMPEDPAAGLSVYKDSGATPAAPAFVPPPEAPGPRVADAPPAAPAAVATAPVHAVGPLAPAAPAPLPVVAVKPPVTKVAAAAPIAAPVKPPAKVAAPAAVASAGGPASVQIGAFSSPALADRGWNDAARVAPGVMAGKGKNVEPVSKGETILYRASITGFASREAAASLCDTLKAAGKTCFVK